MSSNRWIHATTAAACLGAAVAWAAAVSRRTETQLLVDGGPGSQNGYATPAATWGDWAYSGDPQVSRVHVFEHTPAGWTKRTTLASDDGDAFPGLGHALAAQGSRVVATLDPDQGGPAYAYVFVRDDAHAWRQEARLEVPGDPPAWFGRSVAIDGDTIVVGATHDYFGTGATTAHAYRRVGGVWDHTSVLGAPTQREPGCFGWSCAVSGGTIVVGEPFGGLSGAAHVFVQHGAGWDLEATLEPAGGPFAEVQAFGMSVAIDGDTLAVGGQNMHGGRGGVEVYTRRRGVWTRQAEFGAELELNPPHTLFGRSVALRGDRLLVGGTWALPEPAAFTFVRRGGAWFPETVLVEADGAGFGIGATAVALGETVALSHDIAEGNYLYELPLLGPASRRPLVRSAAGTPSAAPGNVLRISGSGFGRTRGEVIVGETPARIVSWGERSIRVAIPDGVHSVPLRVRTADGRAGDGSFAYDPPTVTGVSRSVVAPGASVTLRGSGFGSLDGGGTCRLECGGDDLGAGHPGLVAWSDRKVTFRAPMERGTVLVRVHTAAGESAPVEIEVR